MTDIVLLGLGDAVAWTAAIFIFIGIVVFTVVMLLMKQYKRCPSNRVLVIFGKTGRAGGAAKTIHGGASFVVPLLQDYAYLSLEPIQIEIPLRGALSAENIRVNVPSVFTVAIDTTPEVMQNAAVRLLGLTVPEMRKQAEEIIFGQLRQVIASMHIEEINRDREKFLQHIMVSLEPELNKIGLQLINVNITDITDDPGIPRRAASRVRAGTPPAAQGRHVSLDPRPRRGRAERARESLPHGRFALGSHRPQDRGRDAAKAGSPIAGGRRDPETAAASSRSETAWL